MFLVVGLLTLFASCSNQPTCSNSDVKETVLDLVKENISGELYLAYLQTNDPEKALTFAIEVQALSLAALQKDEEAINSFVSKYEKEMEDNFLNFDPQVSNIRISNKEEELKKCTCEAELSLNNGNSVSLLYNVQINEDGETFVELQIVE